MLSIATFKWGTRYTLDHVARLRSMLARNLTIPWEFVLISDDPEDEHFTAKAGIRYVPLWAPMRGVKNCGVRLFAFHPKMRELIGPRFAWVDMDVVVTGNVDHLFSRPEPFVGLATPAPPMVFNGSFVMMDAGAFPKVFSTWTPERYEQCGKEWLRRGCAGGGASDEGWMSYLLENAPGVGTIGGERGRDGVYYFKRHLLRPGMIPLPPDARLVIMNGKRFGPDLAEWKARAPWILDHWR